MKKDLEVELGEILGGVQRVPALLINNHRTPIADTNLHSYEVLPGESLHDVKGHIKNLLDELKFQVEDNVRKHYEDAYEVAIGDKDALRGSDLRLGLILMTVSLQDKIPERVLELLESLAEISHLLYLPARKISKDNTSALQYHIQACYPLLSRDQVLHKDNIWKVLRSIFPCFIITRCSDNESSGS